MRSSSATRAASLPTEIGYSISMTAATAEAKTPLTVSLYFRTSPKVREDAEQFGNERSLTLSSALAVLVERGLEAVASEDSVRALEKKAQRLAQIGRASCRER